jgi:hypothetical protein
MYRRQINNALDDIIGAAEMYKFLYDEFGQLDTQKLSDHIGDALGKLYQIELKIKTRPNKPDASTLKNTNIT